MCISHRRFRVVRGAEQFSLRRAFTLIELLVVISIIGLLMALLFPAVRGAVERARALQCRNQMRDLGLATLQHDAVKSRLPGFVNKIGNKRAIWLVALFPYKERNDLWERWSDPEVATGPIVHWGEVICPSDPPEGNVRNPLSFVVNCGRPDVDFNDDRANGVFLNVYERSVASTLGYIGRADGQSNTLMISENIQADRWTVTTSDEAERLAGMVWHDAQNSVRRINGDRAALVATSLDMARPSSFHGGGVNAAFCDGHVEWLRDDIAYHVYQQLMAPDSKRSDLPPTAKNYVLDEQDFR